ncbi:hypothetical protein [Altererythrobacter aquiaggeris]|uniref:hypothetical protein n=1 Tax=Aestuarierythrobacter aquiaggeris TaxID=1898396 RepID=UPI00301A439C
MSDNNAFASLSPTLLARKGGAKPAMRPQLASSLAAFDGPATRDNAANLEDLGWNDMGEEEHQPVAGVLALTPEPANPQVEELVRIQDEETAKALRPEILKQQDVIARRFAEMTTFAANEDNAPAPQRPRRSALSRGRRAAFTLRLDADRHLKLKLASTIKGKSAQQLVTEALDRLLGEIPDLSALADQMRRS